jgi:hypothetical protein
MSPLQRYILQTLAPALDADILCESLTDWLHADTLARFHSYGVSFQPLLTELVQFLSDGTLSNFVEYLAAEEADLSDLPPAPAPIAPVDDSDLVEMIIGGAVA